MRPRLQDAVQSVSRAQSLRDLSMAQEFVIRRDFPSVDANLDDLLRGVQLHLRRYGRIESADEGDADAAIVEAEGMGADIIPASADVCEAVAADEEVVGDIWPLLRFNMKGLRDPYV